MEQKGTTSREFYELVKTMRASQKEYFRTRRQDVLINAKYLESRVDRIIAATEANINSRQK